MQLQIEQVALKKEKDSASKERLAKLQKELAESKAEADRLTAQWEAEKEGVQRLGAVARAGRAGQARDRRRRSGETT